MALLHVDFFSEVLGMCCQMDVILPQRTQGQIGLTGNALAGKYPTLYLLHGMSDDHTIWQRRTSIERYVSELGWAVVMPAVQLGWYTNMRHGGRYFDYVAKELPRICREFFPSMSSSPQDTYVAGLSMGGYGALKLALAAPETFGAAASLSGAVDIARRCEEQDGKEPLWTNVFGLASHVRGSENDLFALAESLASSGEKLPPLYMWCGTEDFLINDNRRLRDSLNGWGYSLHYEESAGAHRWDCWDEKIQSVLAWLQQLRG
ncbi:MAG: esterase family protein [Provencibacterium sp.]|jgi:putative tributyrin esterase|nr:esterase family protein [Provencibacterium sp.]